jgi:sugar/nucleoside kinase (ribokinase family)
VLDLVCVGRIVTEMIFSPSGVQGPFLGGPPAYCSMASARQGTAVGIVSTVGADLPPDFLSPLVRAGVDTTGISVGHVSTKSELIYDSAGSKEIRYPEMSRPIEVSDIPSAYRDAALIYLCPMDNDVSVDCVADVARVATLSAVDLGGYGGVHMSRAHRAATPSLSKLACEVASLVDIAKASAEDAASIFGWDDPARSARVLGETGCGLVLVTLGASGVLIWTQGHETLLPAPVAQVLDSTGGGDTFMAGFLSEYLRSRNPTTAAQWGCATAAFVIEGSGGVRAERMPTQDEVQARIYMNNQLMR